MKDTTRADLEKLVKQMRIDGKSMQEIQIEIAAMLQIELLLDWATLLRTGGCTAADRGHIKNLLLESGWDLDPSKLNANDLAQKLTSNIRFDDDLDEPPF